MPVDTEIGPAIDMGHLARYTRGNRALDVEILGLFLAQAPQTLARMAEARDHKQWREAAHSLKGSARGVGAGQLGHLAEAAEKSDRWDALDERAALLDPIRAALAEVEAFVARIG